MARTRALVIEADDLGLSHPFNEGIRRAAAEGWLTSTCIRTNGTAVDAAFDDVLAACPHLGLGVHLNLVEGRSMRTDVTEASELCAPDGTYRLGFVQLLRAGRSPRLLAEIEADFRQQIETVLERRRPDHLNGHQHCHLAPPIFDIVCRLAKEYDIPFVRIPYERTAFAGGGYPWTGIALNTVKMAVVRTLVPRLRPIAARHGVRVNEGSSDCSTRASWTSDRSCGGSRPPRRTGSSSCWCIRPPTPGDGRTRISRARARLR